MSLPPHVNQGEAGSRIERLRLEKQKQILELRSLVRSLSWHGTSLEWLKAATVPAALLGVLVTFMIGSNQIQQTQDARDSERFDRALSRLASSSTNERLTGVAGLRLFLATQNNLRHAATLQFLVNAAAIEDTDIVQNAILDVFRAI